MSTSFNFPANPTLNQIVVLPDGNSAQWNGYTWVSVTNNVTYPLAIPNGGTGATNPSTARINLGLNAATGEFIVQKDGTVTNPGIAFASEPGLGWWRYAAGQIGLAVQGKTIADFSRNSATLTTLFLSPSAAGVAQHVLRNQVLESANFNQLLLAQLADGSATLATGVGGSATRGNLVLDAPNITATLVGGFNLSPLAGNDAVLTLRKNAQAQNNVIYGVSNNTNRWAINLANAGDNFAISRYNSSGVYLEDNLAISISDGTISIGSNNGRLQVNGNAIIVLPDQANLPNTGIGSMVVPGQGSGFVDWNSNNGKPVIQTTAASANLAFWWLRHAVNGVGHNAAIGVLGQLGAQTLLRHYSNNWFFDFAGDGNAIKSGTNTAWVISSDARLKKNVTPYAAGLDEILRLDPVMFDWIDDDLNTDTPRISLLAQDAMGVMPELVGSMDNKARHYSKLELDALYTLNVAPLPYALINAIKTLNERLKAIGA